MLFRSRKSRTIEVPIPAGIEHGTKLVIRGEGESGGKGRQNGDLYVHVAVEPNELFTRRGNDVHMVADVNMVLAALGGTITVETLEDPIEVVINPGTQTGNKARLRGAGITYMNSSGRRGDQIVNLRVVTPTDLNSEQTRLLQIGRAHV